MIVGRPGGGKSFLTTYIASLVSTGGDFPDGSKGVCGSVIFLASEDDPHDTIRPRLDAHGADVSRVCALSGVRHVGATGKSQDLMFTLADVETLESALNSTTDCKLIVVDPIGSYLGGATDAHRDNEVRAVLSPVAALAERYGVAIVMVMHNRKSIAKYADDTAMGSRAFTGIARCVSHLFAEGDSGERKLWLPGKNNLAPPTDGLAFSIEGEPPNGAIVWENDPVMMTADDWMARDNGLKQPQSPALNEAEQWLLNALASGPQPGSELKARAERDGIKSRTLDRAKAKLNVVAKPGGFSQPWVWMLPRADITSSVFTVSANEVKLADTAETVIDSAGTSAV